MPPLCLETTKTENRRIFGDYISQHGFAETADNTWDAAREVTKVDATSKHINSGILPAKHEKDFLSSVGNTFNFADFTDPYERQGSLELVKYTPEQRLRHACDYAFHAFALGSFNIQHSMIEGIIRRETANRSFKDDAEDLAIINGADKYFRNLYKLKELSALKSNLSFDSIQFKPVRVPGTEFDINTNVSIGPAQMQISHIMRLVDSLDSSGKPMFPALQTIRENPLRYALEPEGAALLVAAYMKDKAMRLERGENPCPDLKTFKEGKFHRQNIHILKIWQQGKSAEKRSQDPSLTKSQVDWLKRKAVEHKTDALVRTFNAPAGSSYVSSVREFINKIDNVSEI